VRASRLATNVGLPERLLIVPARTNSVSEVLYDCVNKQADKVPLQKGEQKHKNEVIASLRDSKVEVVNDDASVAAVEVQRSGRIEAGHVHQVSGAHDGTCGLLEWESMSPKDVRR